MNSRLLVALLALAPLAASPGVLVAAEKAAEAPAKRYPLRGVITAILTDRSAVMVKHEDIPGVMRAMTMAFKVDAETMKSLKQGDAITGLVSRQGNSWVLEDVKPATAKRN